MKKYNYVRQQNSTWYAVMQGSYIVCYTETESRAKEIVRLFRKQAREEQFPFGA